MHKTRPAHDEVAIVEVTGRVRDKIAVVGDDVTTTGGTQIAGAKVLKEHGATEVWMFVTHSLLDADALERVAESDITGLVVTDTVPDRPDPEARQRDRADRLAPARGDDHERLRRRVGLRDLRRRHPALLMFRAQLARDRLAIVGVAVAAVNDYFDT